MGRSGTPVPFIVGDSNQEAWQAIQGFVGNEPDSAPLIVLSGPSGTGKSLLLAQARESLSEAGHRPLLLNEDTAEALDQVCIQQRMSAVVCAPLDVVIIDHLQPDRVEDWPAFREQVSLLCRGGARFLISLSGRVAQRPLTRQLTHELSFGVTGALLVSLQAASADVRARWLDAYLSSISFEVAAQHRKQILRHGRSLDALRSLVFRLQFAVSAGESELTDYLIKRVAKAL